MMPASLIPIRLKDNSIRPSNESAMMIAYLVAYTYYCEVGASEFVFTSLEDGKHSEHSLHYTGFGGDIRIWTLPKDVPPEVAANEIQNRLNHHYLVIAEKTHIHIQFKPRYNP